jgi:hypothetical protein
MMNILEAEGRGRP